MFIYGLPFQCMSLKNELHYQIDFNILVLIYLKKLYVLKKFENHFISYYGFQIFYLHSVAFGEVRNIWKPGWGFLNKPHVNKYKNNLNK